MILDDVVFLDLETTGGSPELDRIIEVGLVEVTNGVITDEWSTLVNPGRHVPLAIQALTGITADMLETAPAFADIAPALAARLDGRTIAAHNASFDYRFLRHELLRAGVRYAAPVLCTVRLSRRLYPQQRRHNLDALLVRHALFCIDRHRALGDARVIADVGVVWRREFGDAHVDSICAELVHAVRLPPNLPPDAFDAIPEAPGTYVFFGQNDTALYVGRSANLHSRVLSHFSGTRSGKDAAIAERITRIDWTRTAGELGAALRETELINALAPVYNRPRADDGELCSWRWRTSHPFDPPELVTAASVSEDMLTELYGVFRTRAAARQALRALAPPPIEGEKPIGHAMRLAAALAPLRLKSWPYAGCIGIREYDAGGERSEVHVLDRWRYLGTAHTDAELGDLLDARRPATFSLDNYKLLSRFLKSPPPRCRIVPLQRVHAAAA